MGKASSAKKIKRVQQAGVNRAPGQRRNLAYPALIAGIIVVGLVLVLLARDSRQATASVAPTTRDHWHTAFGIDACGEFQNNLGDAKPDALGIHTHQDGLIHIHPFGSGASGQNATFQKFADQTNLQISNGSFTIPGGKTYKNGDKCGDKEGQVALYVWPPQANDKTEPRVVTENIGDVRFTEDGQIMVLSFNPKGVTPKLPPSVETLKNPADTSGTPQQGSINGSVPASSTPSTTAAAGAAATTVKPGG